MKRVIVYARQNLEEAEMELARFASHHHDITFATVLHPGQFLYEGLVPDEHQGMYIAFAEGIPNT